MIIKKILHLFTFVSENNFKKSILSYWKNTNLTVLFIVAIEMLIQNYTPFFVPFDRAALALTNSTVIDHNLMDQAGSIRSGLRWRELEQFDHPDAPVLLTIEQTTYDNHYAGISPIDRCKLADAVQPLLATNPKVLFIDFDLSPLEIIGNQNSNFQTTQQGIATTQYPQNQFQTCQDKLDKILYQYGHKLVLLEPFQTTPHTIEWQKNLETNGVKFASAQMNASLGLIITSSTNPNSVAKALNKKVSSCSDQECQEDVTNATPINYAGLGKFEDIDPERTTFHENKVIFLGGTYGIDDHHITPIGENTPGIMIQAYDYASTLKPFANNIWVQIATFFIELTLAILIMNILKRLWDIYIRYETSCIPLKHELAIFISMAIYLVSGALAYGSLILAGWLLRGELLGVQIWISPVPIILAIFVYSAKEILFDKLKMAMNKNATIDNHSTCSSRFIETLTKKFPIHKNVLDVFKETRNISATCWIRFIKISIGLGIIYVVLTK